MATRQRTDADLEQRKSIWNVDVRQVVYMALGAALYAGISIIFSLRSSVILV